MRGFYLYASHFNLLIDNNATENGVGNLYDGIYVEYSENNTLTNNLAANNTRHGISLDNSNRSVLNNNTANNNFWSGFSLEYANFNNLTNNSAWANGEYGFILTGLTGAATTTYNILDSNAAFNNSDSGFRIEQKSAYGNNLTNNIAYNNTLNGFVIYNADNNRLYYNFAYENLWAGFATLSTANSNELEKNFAHDNDMYGFYFVSSENNTVRYSTALNNTGYGYLLNMSNRITINHSSALYNQEEGFLVFNSTNISIENSEAHHNTGDGFGLYWLAYLNILKNNIAYLNSQSGFSLGGPTSSEMAYYNNLTNNTAYSNYDGVSLGEAYFNSFSGILAYNNTRHGVYVSKGQYNNFTNTISYGNSQYGIYLIGENENHFWNTFIYNQSSYLRAGEGNNNFTNITFGYNSTIGLINYQLINLSATILNLNSSNFLLNPDWVSMNDSDSNAGQANKSANITIYTDDCLYPVYRKLGFPVSLDDIRANGTSYTTADSCPGSSAPFTATFNVSGFCGYAFNSPSCVNLSDSSTWGSHIVNSSGILYVNQNTQLCRDHYYMNVSDSTPLLEMNASNIWLNCSGAIIDGVNGRGYGIYINNKENNTIKDCNVSRYYIGFYDNRSYNTLYLNDIAYQNPDYGLFVSYSNYTHIYNVSASGGSSINIRFYLSNFSIIENCTVQSPNNRNIEFYDSHNNTVYGCSIINSGTINGHGVQFLSSTGNRILNNNITTVLHGSGVYVGGSNSNTIANNVISNATESAIFCEWSQSSLIENNTLYNNSVGINLTHHDYGTFNNNTIYGNNRGLILYQASGNVFKNTTIYGNANSGLRSNSSAGNNFTDTFIYNNNWYGIESYSSNNTLSNTLVHTQYSYLFFESSSFSNFTNLTLGYNATVGLINYPSLNLTSGIAIQETYDIYLQPDWVSLDASTPDADDLNKSAYITINNSACGTMGVLREDGFPVSLASILSNGRHYPATVSCDGDRATFHVDGFSAYTLGQEITRLTFAINESSGITYGTPINISCNASNSVVPLEIFSNGTSIAGPQTGYVEYTGVLAAGYYNFSCNATGNENYTSAEASELFRINRAAPAVTFSASPGWAIRPGETVNISCNTSNPQITIELWNSTGMIGSGSYVEYVGTFAAGTYQYTCNSTETENYTAFSQTETLNVRRPSEGGEPERCSLRIFAPDSAFANTPVQVGVQRMDGTSEGPMLNNAKLTFTYIDAPAGSAPPTAVHYTNIGGYTDEIYFTQDGTWRIYAEFGDCEMAEDSMEIYSAPEAYSIGFEQRCDGSIVTLTTEVCEVLGAPAPGMGEMGCRQVPVQGVTVEAYFCPAGAGADCTDRIGTYTTDEGGHASILAFDGVVKVVAYLMADAEPRVEYFGLPSSEDCPPPSEEISINFDPSCDGSTVSVTGTVCTGGTLVSDVSSAPYLPYGECREGPLSGMRVSIYCCPENWDRMDLPIREICTRQVDSGTTDSSGMFVTGARDCTALIYVEGGLGTPAEGTYLVEALPTTQECAECLSDSDCPEGYVCRSYECVPGEIPPEQRKCSADGDCTHGYRCSGGQCTQIRTCAVAADCGAGQGCLNGICYTDEEIEAITGGEGGVEGGGLQRMLENVVDTVVKSAWLILLLLVCLLLFLLFWWNRRKKKKRLTTEEMIAKEQESGIGPQPPRQPRHSAFKK